MKRQIIASIAGGLAPLVCVSTTGSTFAYVCGVLAAGLGAASPFDRAVARASAAVTMATAAAGVVFGIAAVVPVGVALFVVGVESTSLLVSWRRVALRAVTAGALALGGVVLGAVSVRATWGGLVVGLAAVAVLVTAAAPGGDGVVSRSRRA